MLKGENCVTITFAESCTRCGRCAEVCPTEMVYMRDGAPTRKKAWRCIACGQCEAVCPVGALHKDDLPHDNILPVAEWPVLDAQTAELFLRSRRSIRHFKQEEVDPALTEKLLDIGRYAQTGSNRQSVSYLVVSPAKMAGVRELLEEFFRNSDDPDMQLVYRGHAVAKGDSLLRSAPMMLLALTERGDAYIARNGYSAFTYVELYAPTLGLGTCWAGYFERYARTDCPKLRAHLEIPESKVVSAALLYGYPKYRYYRTTGRQPLEIHWR